METTLSKDYKERIVPALVKEFGYATVMQVPRLEKIVINQGLGEATQDKKLIDIAVNELTAITGQKCLFFIAATSFQGTICPAVFFHDNTASPLLTSRALGKVPLSFCHIL